MDGIINAASNKTKHHLLINQNFTTMGKKVALATLAGFVTLFILGYLVYEVLMKGSMAEMQAAAGACMSTEPAYAYIIVATLVQSLLISLVLYKFNATTFQSGLMNSAWVVLLICLWYDIWFLTSMPWFTNNMAIMDVVMNTVQSAIAGGVIGWVLGKVK